MGFRHHMARGQDRRQRRQSLAEDADQAPFGPRGTPLRRAPGARARATIGRRARRRRWRRLVRRAPPGLGRRLRLAADGQHVPRGHRRRQPQSPHALGVGHPRRLPLPAVALEQPESVLDPAPHPVPQRLGPARGQVGQHEPGPRAPAPSMPRGCTPAAAGAPLGTPAPALANVGPRGPSAVTATLDVEPASRNLLRRVIRISGCQPSRDDLPVEPAAAEAAIGHHQHGRAGRDQAGELAEQGGDPLRASRARATLPGRTFQATGIAPPR